jgi:hypothetical protein
MFNGHVVLAILLGLAAALPAPARDTGLVSVRGNGIRSDAVTGQSIVCDRDTTVARDDIVRNIGTPLTRCMNVRNALA